MERHIVKILSTAYVTHDVKRFIVEKPAGYHYVPGQATEVAVNSPSLENEKRPFTFTSLTDAAGLEFTIKIYRDRNGVTAALEKLKNGDELIIHDVWGAITYKGPGVFIAGGAGITPFIAILRDLYRRKRINGNMLIFSIQTSKDVICEEEFALMMGKEFHKVFTREHVIGFSDKRIDKDYLIETIKDFNRNFYICGPEAFVSAMQATLLELGASSDAVVIEK